MQNISRRCCLSFTELETNIFNTINLILTQDGGKEIKKICTNNHCHSIFNKFLVALIKVSNSDIIQFIVGLQAKIHLTFVTKIVKDRKLLRYHSYKHKPKIFCYSSYFWIQYFVGNSIIFWRSSSNQLKLFIYEDIIRFNEQSSF